MDPLLEVSLRWAHVIAGLCWIGLLYFFNFVNVPFQGTIDPATKKVVNPQLLSRALWWFRMAAMTTFLIGLYLFIALYMKKPEDGGLMREVGKEGLSARAMTIMIGMTLGIIMWFNVWFIIWPNQKKIIAGMLSGTPAAPECAKRALLASRFNCYSSGPMLFLMLAAKHGGSLGTTGYIVAFALPLLVIHLAIKASGNVAKPA
jgi:uncharacterized membrane protein